MIRYIDTDALNVDFIQSHTANADVYLVIRKILNDAPIADVVPRAEVFEEVDHFRDELMDLFHDLCRGNDFNKLTLFKIGCAVDEIYDRRMAELEKKYKGDINV